MQTKIVCRGHCVEVSSEVEIDIFHRHLRITSSCSTAFDTKHRPIDGSLITQVADCPIRQSAWVRPIVVTVLPSPNGVGLTEVTKTRLPEVYSCGFTCIPGDFSHTSTHGHNLCGEIPSFHAIASIGSRLAAFVISSSVA